MTDSAAADPRHADVHASAAQSSQEEPEVLGGAQAQTLEDKVNALDAQLTQRINQLRKDTDEYKRSVSKSVSAFQDDIASLKTSTENNEASIKSFQGALDAARHKSDEAHQAADSAHQAADGAKKVADDAKKAADSAHAALDGAKKAADSAHQAAEAVGKKVTELSGQLNNFRAEYSTHTHKTEVSGPLQPAHEGQPNHPQPQPQSQQDDGIPDQRG